MNRTQFLKLLSALLALTIGLFGGVVHAAPAALPASGWYAVAWNRASNTLHWINAGGEQASIERPRLPEEAIDGSNARVTVSPNGRTLVITAVLTNGREGIGFYDLAVGQFIRTHTADAFETFLNPGRYAFTESSTHAVAALKNAQTGDWRLIVFEIASGNAVDQLTRTSPNTPANFITDPSWQPSIVQFNVDEGSGSTEVRFQIWDSASETMSLFPSFKWFPATNGIVPAQPVVADAFPYNPRAGFDIQPMTGQTVLAWFDDAQGQADIGSAANSIRVQQSSQQLPAAVFTQYGANTRQPVWLKNGEWIGYRLNNGVMQPHRVVMTADGQNALPLGPNIAALYHTPDGFLALDNAMWTLMHQTDLNLEGFSAVFGTTVYAPGTEFNVVYTTPAATAFTLASVAGGIDTVAGADDIAPQVTPVTIGGTGNFDTQPTNTQPARAPLATETPLPRAPLATPTNPPRAQNPIPQPEQVCLLAPEKKLALNDKAYVADLGGTLALRTNLSDAFPSHQLPARTVVDIIDGPTCLDGYRMWRVSTTLNGQAVTGWVSEGTQQSYFLRQGLPRAVNN